MNREAFFLDHLLSGGRIEIYDGPRPGKPEDKPIGKPILVWDGSEMLKKGWRPHDEPVD